MEDTELSRQIPALLIPRRVAQAQIDVEAQIESAQADFALLWQWKCKIGTRPILRLYDV